MMRTTASNKVDDKGRIRNEAGEIMGRETVSPSLQTMLKNESGYYNHQSGYLGGTINVECRRLMADWCVRVVDRCGYSRDTVSFALNYLDRFCCGRKLEDKNRFQLIAMTCLYIAIKLFHEMPSEQMGVMHPCTIAGWSHGAYTVEDVEKMELEIMFGLDWKLHPPTPRAFLHQFSTPYLPRAALLQTDLAVLNHDLVMTYKPSWIAYCALLNSGEDEVTTIVPGITIPDDERSALQHRLKLALEVTLDQQQRYNGASDQTSPRPQSKSTIQQPSKEYGTRVSASPRDVRTLPTKLNTCKS